MLLCFDWTIFQLVLQHNGMAPIKHVLSHFVWFIYVFLTMLPNNSTVQKRTLRKACSVPEMRAGPDGGNRVGLRNVRFWAVGDVGDSPRTLGEMCSLERLGTLQHTKRRMAEWWMGDELKKTSKESACDLIWDCKLQTANSPRTMQFLKK